MIKKLAKFVKENGVFLRNVTTHPLEFKVVEVDGINIDNHSTGCVHIENGKVFNVDQKLIGKELGLSIVDVSVMIDKQRHS